MKENQFIESAYKMVKSKPFQVIYGIATMLYVGYAFYNVHLGIQEKKRTILEEELT